MSAEGLRVEYNFLLGILLVVLSKLSLLFSSRRVIPTYHEIPNEPHTELLRGMPV